ncbi:hypothetical protein [Methanothermobacter sp. KEPCO 2]|uniref:hypothetical protein n=1 Tax=Methanothermobacter sp. KEPCO 2 TaxID=3240977 RepID=UPI0035121D74
MKYKRFILTLLAVFAITAAIVLSGWLQGDDWPYSSMLYQGDPVDSAAYILILDVIVMLFMTGLKGVIIDTGGCYDHDFTGTLLISALFTLGFNLIGLTNAIITETPINKNVVGTACVALTVTATAYIAFTVLTIIKPVTDSKD